MLKNAKSVAIKINLIIAALAAIGVLIYRQGNRYHKNALPLDPPELYNTTVLAQPIINRDVRMYFQ
jgi:hypothetical protein